MIHDQKQKELEEKRLREQKRKAATPGAEVTPTQADDKSAIRAREFEDMQIASKAKQRQGMKPAAPVKSKQLAPLSPEQDHQVLGLKETQEARHAVAMKAEAARAQAEAKAPGKARVTVKPATVTAKDSLRVEKATKAAQMPKPEQKQMTIAQRR